jgi:amino acid permease
MKKQYERAVLEASEVRVLFVLLVVIFLRARHKIKNSFLAAINWLYYFELFIFPPLAFLSTFLTTSKYFPSHPIKIFAVLSTSFMFATLALFLLRPRKWKRTAHWVKA